MVDIKDLPKNTIQKIDKDLPRYAFQLMDSGSQMLIAEFDTEVIRKRDVKKLFRAYEGLDLTFRFVDRKEEVQYQGRFGVNMLNPVQARNLRSAKIDYLLAILKYEQGFNVILK